MLIYNPDFLSFFQFNYKYNEVLEVMLLAENKQEQVIKYSAQIFGFDILLDRKTSNVHK